MIRLYQEIAVSWMLDKSSWEYLVSVLLHHTWQLLTHKHKALGHVLATPLLKVRELHKHPSSYLMLWWVWLWLQILLFCFLRMSMAVPDVNLALWEALMHLIHSLTHWKEVIEQWKVRSGFCCHGFYRTL